MVSRILAFDIGIKNLAWACISKGENTSYLINGWSNENLITGGTADSDAVNNQCETCKKKASYTHLSSSKHYCVKHCPPLTPALRDLSGNLLKKIPKLEILKTIATRMDATKEDLKNKTTMTTFLQSRLCFPKVSATLVKKVELEALHDGIRAVIIKNKELFGSCSQILLENQPAYKNPVMKSVQMMLFASLRDLLQPEVPKVRLVHASRKTVDTVTRKGDEGYSERKGAAEKRVLEGFRAGKLRMNCADGRDASWFGLQVKKSDLADCLCMAMDSA
jgi:hypothetical protein